MNLSDTTARKYEESDPDVRLMLRLARDDAGAFETLVERYQNRLFNFLRNYVGDEALAEDLTQEVFLRVFRSRKRYRPRAKFSSWLFTIAVNVANNSRRSQARRREIRLGSGRSGSASFLAMQKRLQETTRLLPGRQVDRAEAADLVRAAVDTLNHRQRLAVLLSKFEGMSYIEIAETMNLTPEAVKSLLTRARNNLRTILQPYFEQG